MWCFQRFHRHDYPEQSHVQIAEPLLALSAPLEIRAACEPKIEMFVRNKHHTNKSQFLLTYTKMRTRYWNWFLTKVTCTRSLGQTTASNTKRIRQKQRGHEIQLGFIPCTFYQYIKPKFCTEKIAIDKEKYEKFKISMIKRTQRRQLFKKLTCT